MTPEWASIVPITSGRKVWMRRQAIEARQILTAALEVAGSDELEAGIYEASRMLNRAASDLCRRGALE